MMCFNVSHFRTTVPLMTGVLLAVSSRLLAMDPTPTDARLLTRQVVVDPLPASPPPTAIDSDPLPASPPTTGGNDPLPASPPESIATDPLPASPPSAAAQDPLPASAPETTVPVDADSIVLLFDMPQHPRPSSTDLEPAQSPQSKIPTATAVSFKPFFGVGFRDPSSPVVTTLYTGSTAAKLGVSLGDRVDSLNQTPVRGIETLRGILSQMKTGDPVEVVITRDGNSFCWDQPR